VLARVLVLLGMISTTVAFADPCPRVDPLDAWGVAPLGLMTTARMDMLASRTKYCTIDADDQSCMYRDKNGVLYFVSYGSLENKKLIVADLPKDAPLPFGLAMSDTPEIAAAKIAKRTGVAMTQVVVHGDDGELVAALSAKCELSKDTKRWLVVRFDANRRIASVNTVIGHPGD
jgi:hypothetical protein